MDARAVGIGKARSGRRDGATHAAIGRVLAALLAVLAISALAAARAAATEITSPYGPVYEKIYYGPHYRQFLDIYESTTPNAPLVILVHGGGWRYPDALSKFAKEAEALQERGDTVFVMQYDQDSEKRAAFPIEPADVMLATRWAIANAHTYDANPNDVVLLGGSAGGNLVALAAEALDAESAGTVRGVITLSAPTDFPGLLTLIEDGTITNENFIESVTQALGRDAGSELFASLSEEEEYPVIWSPTRHVPAKNCPNWLLFNSEAELIPLSQAQQLTSALQSAKCNATLNVVPGGKHAFGYWGLAKDAIATFIAAQ